MNTALAALIIATLSLTVAIIGSVLAIKNYKKSKRLEFFQRRDQLFAKIAELNAKNSEAHLISARFEIIQSNRQSVFLTGKLLEDNLSMIARIERLRDNMGVTIKNWGDNINDLHKMCSNLKEKDAPQIEELLAMVQKAIADIQNHNEISLASLHIMEALEPKTIASVTELQELELQSLALEKAKEEK